MRKILLLIMLIPVGFFAQSLPLEYSLDINRLNKTTNDPKPASNSIDDIIVMGDTIILATGDGVSISVDDGESWRNTGELEEFKDLNVSRITYDKEKGVLWAGLWHYVDVIGGKEAAGAGLRYSQDLGETWTSIDQPLDQRSDSTIVYGINTLRALAVMAEEQNYVLDIEIISGDVWITSRAGGVRKSSDMGQTWERIVLPPDYLDYIHPDSSYYFELSGVAGVLMNEENLNHIAFSLLNLGDGEIYVGTAGGINKSTDGGISWRKFNRTNQEKPISGNHIWFMNYDDTDNSIWACTWRADSSLEYNGVSVSRDRGETWDVFMPGARFEGLDFRYFPNKENFTRRDVIAVGRDDGMFRTSDNGQTWIKAPTIVDNATRLELITDKMYAIDIRHDGNTADIFVGTNIGGLVRMTEENYEWDGLWKLYYSEGDEVNSVNTTFAYPNPFSPLRNNISIKYSVNHSADVTIRIFDFGMNLVKTLIQNAGRLESDEVIERWNGRDEHGNYVANGVYFYRIDVGSDDPLFGKILVIK